MTLHVYLVMWHDRALVVQHTEEAAAAFLAVEHWEASTPRSTQSPQQQYAALVYPLSELTPVSQEPKVISWKGPVTCVVRTHKPSQLPLVEQKIQELLQRTKTVDGKLLRVLVRHRGSVVPYSILYQEVWGKSDATKRSLDSAVHRLVKEGVPVKNKRSTGYILE